MELKHHWYFRFVAVTIVVSTIYLHSKSHAAEEGRSNHTNAQIARPLHIQTSGMMANLSASNYSLGDEIRLFYKEAIHNVLKHSCANEVAIRLWDEEDALALEIFDNGVGLPVTDRQTSHVKKLQERANLLQGLLQVASNQGDGTTIGLYVKQSYLTHHQSALS